MQTFQYSDSNSPLWLIDGIVECAGLSPAKPPRIQYVGGFYDCGVVVAVQVIGKDQAYEVLVNPLDEAGQAMLYTLSKQPDVAVGGIPVTHPPLVRRELATLLERAKTHPVTRPQWDKAVASYKKGE